MSRTWREVKEEAGFPVKPIECIGKRYRGYKCVIEHGHGETACGLVPRWWNLPARMGF